MRSLTTYRRSFTKAYEEVAERIRVNLNLDPTGRPAKSTTSITDKLRRESVRLSQVQDIAGCRLVVANVTDQDDQDNVVTVLKQIFAETMVVDRRAQSSHGYRAVHVIVNLDGKLVEIQVRTTLQHQWAEVSEKISDVVDPSIKYGSGDKDSLIILDQLSRAIQRHEVSELRLSQAVAEQDLDSEGIVDGEVTEAQNELAAEEQDIIDLLNAAAVVLPRIKGRKP